MKNTALTGLHGRRDVQPHDLLQILKKYVECTVIIIGSRSLGEINMSFLLKEFVLDRVLMYLSARDTVVLQCCQKRTYCSKTHQRRRHYSDLVLNPLIVAAKKRHKDIEALRAILKILPSSKPYGGDFRVKPRWTPNSNFAIDDEALNAAESNMSEICRLAKENVLVVDRVYRTIKLQGVHSSQHFPACAYKRTQDCIVEPDLSIFEAAKRRDSFDSFQISMKQWHDEIQTAKTTKLKGESLMQPYCSSPAKIWWV